MSHPLQQNLLQSAGNSGQLGAIFGAGAQPPKRVAPMPLIDSVIRAAKPGSKPIKLYDRDGLYLEISPTDGRWWRFKYGYAGKEKRISLGTYPTVVLKEARVKRDDATRQLAAGIDLSQVRKAEKADKRAQADAFEVIAREWFSKFSPTWELAHAEKVIRRLARDVFPWIGARPVAVITAPELLAVLRRIESRGTLETAHRARQTCGQVFRYAIATERAVRHPAGDLRGALPPCEGAARCDWSGATPCDCGSWEPLQTSLIRGSILASNWANVLRPVSV